MHSPTPKAPMNLGREPFRQLPCQLGLVRAIVLAYVETDLQQADELLRQPLVYVELLDALRFLEPSRFLCALTLHLCLCFCLFNLGCLLYLPLAVDVTGLRYYGLKGRFKGANPRCRRGSGLALRLTRQSP